MSSRQEEKERRKEERLRLEREAAARDKRRRAVQLGGAVAVVIAVIAGAVIASTTRGGSADTTDAADAADPNPDPVPLPRAQREDLAAAVKAAGCTLGQFADEGQEHVAETTVPTYKTNPPTSGDHFQVAAEDGQYSPGSPPPTGNWVHSLEHGRVLLQYRPGTPPRRIGQLRTLFDEPYGGGPAGYHTLLLENTTQMPFAVAAVTWTRYVGCDRFTDRTFDALRAFRERFVDQAPEQVP